MTLRDAGAAAIALMGVYFASHVVALYVALMLTPYLVSPDVFSAGDPALAASISSAIGNLAVSMIAIAGANRIAAVLFPAIPIPRLGSSRDLLFVGLSLLGIWVALDAVVALARTGGAYVSLVRQQIPAASLERALPQGMANVFSLLAGLAVTWSAPALSRRLDRFVVAPGERPGP